MHPKANKGGKAARGSFRGSPHGVDETGQDALCLAVSGPHGAGKTTYLEHLLARHGLVDRLGQVDDGTSHLASDPEEAHHGMSLSLAVASLKTPEGPVFALDSPGETDFAGEWVGARAVTDLALLFVAGDSDPGPVVRSWCKWARGAGVPCLVAVSRLDRPYANFTDTVSKLSELTQTPVLPLAVPIGQGEELLGILDLIRSEHHGPGHVRRSALPAELEAGKKARAAVEEAAAEGDDELLARYLDAGHLADDDIWRGVRERAAQGALWALPVAAPRDLGIDLIVEMARLVAPGAGCRAGAVQRPSARVFKTVSDPYVGRLSLVRVLSGELVPDLHLKNTRTGEEERLGQLFHVIGRRQVPVTRLLTGEVGAVPKLVHTLTGDVLADAPEAAKVTPLVFPGPHIRMAVRATQQAAEDKLGPALQRLAEEDPTLTSHTDPDSDELVMEGLGMSHLEVASERLARKFGIEVNLFPPAVPYRETILGHARAEAKHKKQSGGHGQYGHVILEIEPFPDGEFAFADKIFGGVVPQQYRPAVEKGVREAMARGVLAAYPVTGVKVTLVDGSYHSVDSSEMAFKIAAALAFEKGCREAGPVLLEPLLEVEVECPEAFTGPIMEDLQRRRAHIQGIDAVIDGLERVRAHVPQAEMLHYSTELRSITGGWAAFTARPHHYAQVPPAVAAHIIASRQAVLTNRGG